MKTQIPTIGVFAFGLIATLAFAAWIYQLTPNTAIDRQAFCMPANCFCEAVSSTIPKQPSNTWSSLGFVFVGLIIALKGKLPIFTNLYSLALYFVGIGSAYYHALLSYTGQVLDVLGMFLVITTVLCYRWAQASGRNWIGVWLMLNAVALGAQAAVPSLRRYLFGIVMLVFLMQEFRLRSSTTSLRNFNIALGTFTLAFLVWTLDITRTVCQPDLWLQGHAVWHLLGAISCWFLYKHSSQFHLTPE